MNEEDIALLLELGGQNDADQQQIATMLEQAKALREQGATPQMRGNRRVQTAAHPLEFLGGLANQYAGRQVQNQAGAMQQGVAGRTQQQNQMMAKMLAGQQPPAPVPNGAPGMLNAPRSPFRFGEPQGGEY